MNKKILCVDDEPAILNCLRRALELRGYRVVTTTSPDEGLRLLKEDPELSLVTLDIRMPGKTGFEIYGEYRKIRKLPALFVTAYPKSFDAHQDEVVTLWQEEFADGTTDILYKPFDLPILYEKVEGLIGPAQE